MLTYEGMTIQDIAEWCKANNQVKWLKELAATTVKVERYTGRKQKLDADGKPALNKKGYPIYVVDKASQKVTEEMPISFMQIKVEFVNKFMPELAPKKKDKKPNMYDLIANL